MLPNASDAASDDTAATAGRVRRRLLDLARTRPVHLGASLSVVDILLGVHRSFGFDPDRLHDPDRHRLVLSKGHSVWALYCVLAELGVPGLEDPRAGHPLDGTPGVEAATGALGHGLSIGAGLAEAARLDGSARRTVVVMGDGELDEGSVWEAAMFAAHRALGNLTAVVDRNTLQQEGPTEHVLALEPLAGKWRAFGWHVTEVDGHDHRALDAALQAPPGPTGPPRLVLARTVKGRGVTVMEGDPRYHHLQLSDEQHRDALRDLTRDPAVAR